MSADIDPRLLKIVALAKHGTPGEQRNAKSLLVKLCARLGVEYDDVMREDEAEHEYVIYFKTMPECIIVSQVVRKWMQTGQIFWNKYRKVIFVTTTAAKYIELSHACDIYLREFRRQRRRLLDDMAGAFVAKNDLYGPGAVAAGRKLTDAQRSKLWREANLSEALDHVKINKAIGDGKSTQ